MPLSRRKIALQNRWDNIERQHCIAYDRNASNKDLEGTHSFKIRAMQLDHDRHHVILDKLLGTNVLPLRTKLFWNYLGKKGSLSSTKHSHSRNTYSPFTRQDLVRFNGLAEVSSSIDCSWAELLFDTQQLVVFGKTFWSAWSSSFDLTLRGKARNWINGEEIGLRLWH